MEQTPIKRGFPTVKKVAVSAPLSQKIGREKDRLWKKEKGKVILSTGVGNLTQFSLLFLRTPSWKWMWGTEAEFQKLSLIPLPLPLCRDSHSNEGQTSKKKTSLGQERVLEENLHSLVAGTYLPHLLNSLLLRSVAPPVLFQPTFNFPHLKKKKVKSQKVAFSLCLCCRLFLQAKGTRSQRKLFFFWRQFWTRIMREGRAGVGRSAFSPPSILPFRKANFPASTKRRGHTSNVGRRRRTPFSSFNFPTLFEKKRFFCCCMLRRRKRGRGKWGKYSSLHLCYNFGP